MTSKPERTALAGLLTGALVWGLIWYPYRLLESLGLSGVSASLATYAVALAGGAVAFRSAWPSLRPTPLVLAIGLATGACNLGYVLGMLQGEVMRVLLLFYLAPLWTVPLARLVLGERLNAAGMAVVALSVAGAVTMLWRPDLGLPVPLHSAEWLGLGAGFCFALSNVLSRRAAYLTEEAKSLVMFLGVMLLGALLLPFGNLSALPPPERAGEIGGLVLLIGVVLLAVNMAVQYGLAHRPANRAVVIRLCELVVAAFGAWLLAGEQMAPREWLGGAMIAGASLLSGLMGSGESEVGSGE